MFERNVPLDEWLDATFQAGNRVSSPVFAKCSGCGLLFNTEDPIEEQEFLDHICE